MNSFVRPTAWLVSLVGLALAGCSSWPFSTTTWRQASVGITVNPPRGSPALATLRPEFEAAQAAGATFVRTPIRWDAIEPAPGQYDWSHADALVGLTNDKLKLRLMPHVGSPPAWAADDPARRAEFAAALADRYAGRLWSPAANQPFAADAPFTPAEEDFATIDAHEPEAIARAMVTALGSAEVNVLAWEPRGGASEAGTDAFAQIARWFTQPYQILQPKVDVTRGDDEVRVRGFRLKDGRFIVAAWLDGAPGAKTDAGRGTAREAEVQVRFSMPGVSAVQLTDARGTRLPESRARWGERWFAIELDLTLEGGGVVFAEASPARP